MKRTSFFYVCLFLLAFVNATFFAQEGDGSFNFENEIAQRINTPQTPEANAFMSYGDVGANLYSGTPDISVPIYTHKGREMSLPINLSYDASGIKVNQTPGLVGLGWNLNVGGRITRIVNGLPDDRFPNQHGEVGSTYLSWYNASIKNKMIQYSDSDYWFTSSGVGGSHKYNTELEAINYMEFLKAVHEQSYETQPDYYSLNVMGLNETFTLDLNTKEPYSLDNPNTDIEISGAFSSTDGGIDGFIVKDDKGYDFHFTAVDQTRILKDSDTGTHFGASAGVTYTSAWYLTKIISPHGKDTYEFEYSSYVDNRNQDYSTGLSEVLTSLVDEYQQRTTSQVHVTTTTQYLNRQVLSKIKYNGNVIVEAVHQNNILNGPDAGITSIQIFNQGTASNGVGLLQAVDFDYDYFKTDTSINHTQSIKKPNVRLKLNKITLKDANDLALGDYKFTYFNPNTIAKLGSFGQDYLGFYNGADSNQVLYPNSTTSSNRYPRSYGFSFPSSGQGANRSTSFIHMKKGMLYEIQYPTGGKTTFEYEQAKESIPIHSDDAIPTNRLLLQHNNLILPTEVYDTWCNAMTLDGDLSPSVTSQVFEIPYNGSGNHTIQYTRTGSTTNTIFGTAGKQVVLVKLPDENTTYQWSDIFNNDCEPLINENNIIWQYDEFDDFIEDSIHLDQGYYQLFIATYREGYNKEVSIDGYNITSVINYQYEDRAGIRIKSIKDYVSTTINNPARVKEYQYTIGRVINAPVFEYFTNEQRPNAPSTQNPSPNGLSFFMLHRASQPLNAQGLHVAYPSVKELAIDFANNDTIVNNFNFFTPSQTQDWYRQGNYQIPQAGGSYGATNYSKLPYFGQVNKQWNNSESKIVDSLDVVIPHNRQRTFGIATHALGQNSNLYPSFELLESGKWIIRLNSIGDNTGGPNIFGENVFFWTAPADCAIGFCSPEYARIGLHKTNPYGNYGGMVAKETTQIDGVENQIIYTYTDDQRKYLKKTTTIVSDGDVIVNENLYPEDIPSEYQSLINKRILYTVVENNTLVNGQINTATKNTFNPLGLPDKVYTKKFNNPYDLRMSIAEYDNKNPVQIDQENGRSTSYLWGYDDRYLVAKIENAKYSELSSLNLGEINQGLTQSQEQILRTSLPNALITTYTYKPLVGVTSVTDPRGYTMYYQYDAQNRLEYVKDQDGKVYSKNEYHYSTSN